MPALRYELELDDGSLVVLNKDGSVKLYTAKTLSKEDLRKLPSDVLAALFDKLAQYKNAL